MKIEITKEVDVVKLQVSAKVRYWEDTSVNGVEDVDGELIPCREGDYWKPVIDIETGVIENWENGKTADIHYKVCDCGIYNLLDAKDEIVVSKDGYVPIDMCPGGSGYGDYIIMKVFAGGLIENWHFIGDEF